MPLVRPFLAIALCGVAAAASFTVPALAQQVFRIVGPDGKVTFSDRPTPTAQPRAGAVNPTTTGATDVTPPAASTLPYELRQVAQRFPVTLYTGKDCAPCTAARNMLVQRGVPFTERTIESNDDVDALQRLSGGNSMPFGTIGGQQLKGFSDLEWTQFLDAAGYPKSSQLPANYRAAPATPLVAVRAATPAAAAAPTAPAAAAAARPPAPPAAGRSNPAGIQF